MADEGAPHADTLLLHFEGFEGPLERLLDLARARRFDPARLPLALLVDQYLAHVEGEARPRIELAAEYLVMAAWLAYLKSASLLPADPDPEPEPHALAIAEAHRALRLAAMRDAAQLLALRALAGRDRHARGAPEGLDERTVATPTANLHALALAYARVTARATRLGYAPHRRAVVTMAGALSHLAAALSGLGRWTPLAALVPPAPGMARSAWASTFAAALELARAGKLAVRQASAFAPIDVHAR